MRTLLAGAAASVANTSPSGFQGFYTPLLRELLVVFPDGYELVYHDVPMELGMRFMLTPSGTTYNKEIRGKYA